jgi:hypothetical protein
MRFEVFTAVTIMMMFFWRAVSIFRAEDGDSTLLRNVGFYHPVHTAPKPRRTSSLMKYTLQKHGLLSAKGTLPDLQTSTFVSITFYNCPEFDSTYWIHQAKVIGLPGVNYRTLVNGYVLYFTGLS